LSQREPKEPHIVISDRDPGLPFSKGLMASQVMVTGLSPVRAYQVAEAIEERLRERGVPSVSNEELGELGLAVLGDAAGRAVGRDFPGRDEYVYPAVMRVYDSLERGRFTISIAAPGFVSVSPVVDLYRDIEVNFALTAR